jgi:hypothetical protein
MLRLRLRHSLVVAASAVLCAGGAQATPIVFTTELSGANENPPVPSSGSGFSVVSYDPDTSILTVSVQFQDLTGTSTVAHIHCCTDPSLNVGVATFPGTFPGFPVGVQAGSYDGSWDLSLATSYTTAFLTGAGGTAALAEAALLEGMLDGRAYVNVHSTFAPGGEIRGHLAVVPEPSAMALFGIGALIVSRRAGRRPRHAP